MSENELDRSVLDGKDREELHAIAGAMGVRAATRMKKADLIDAILGAGNNEGGSAGPDGSNDSAASGSDEKPKRVRSRRASEADDPIAELAAEEEAIAAAGAGDDKTVEPQPAARPATSNASSGNGGSDASGSGGGSAKLGFLTWSHQSSSSSLLGRNSMVSPWDSLGTSSSHMTRS